LQDPVREVRETCELAIDNIKDRLASGENGDDAAFDAEFQSVDPALADKSKKTTQQLRDQLLDKTQSLYKRYKAMFALRNRVNATNDLKALQALCDGFTTEDGALFKHEIAFVLGQLQRKESAQALEKILRDSAEHEMVRHEAAEALGSISDPQSLQILSEFQKDGAEAVRESCIVAVDMHEYWSKWSTSNKSNEEEEEQEQEQEQQQKK